ncbi:MAG: hypothetical protein BWY85_00124 [Firmicutes bacterium ADurb.Bin506]|nr:MAG: hypothetical protein BWY85_00124 [Firmicutes bacterium ADurb.Bin506]
MASRPKTSTPPVAPAEAVAPTENTVLSMAKRLTVLSEARTSISDAQEALIRRCNQLRPDLACPQDALQAFLLLKQIKDDAEKTLDAVKEAFIGHFNAKGEFEGGKFAITIKVIPKTTVPWKDVATEHGRTIATLKSEVFNVDKWEDQMRCQYGKFAPQTQVQVVQSA